MYCKYVCDINNIVYPGKGCIKTLLIGDSPRVMRHDAAEVVTLMPS